MRGLQLGLSGNFFTIRRVPGYPISYPVGYPGTELPDNGNPIHSVLNRQVW